MKLSLNVIKSYGFERRINKPDHDDIQYIYTLPNGIELSCLVVCSNEVTDCDELFGFDDLISIETVEELEMLMDKTFEVVCKELAEEHGDDFDINEYI